MFYYLDSNDAIEFALRRNLLDSSNEHLGTCRARDLCALGRKLCADTLIEQRARLVKQVAVATADFQSLRALMYQGGLTDVRRLPYPHAFPLGLIAAKFRLSMPSVLARLKMWVPATTVAAYGRVP